MKSVDVSKLLLESKIGYLVQRVESLEKEKKYSKIHDLIVDDFKFYFSKSECSGPWFFEKEVPDDIRSRVVDFFLKEKDYVKIHYLCGSDAASSVFGEHAFKLKEQQDYECLTTMMKAMKTLGYSSLPFPE